MRISSSITRWHECRTPKPIHSPRLSPAARLHGTTQADGTMFVALSPVPRRNSTRYRLSRSAAQVFAASTIREMWW
jgi:hypothetical protein